jgi:trehalose-phosphatase
VVEDSLAGVEAGKVGGFGAVIGVDRGGQKEQLKDHGAELVVNELTELPWPVKPAAGQERTLPSALEHIDDIFKQLQKGIPAIFLDYDGTLTPIVSEPSLAVLSEEMREVIGALAMSCLVSIISGRDLTDVRKMVGLNNMAYAGSHGFEIVGPGGSFHEQGMGTGFLPTLDATERELRSAVGGVNGAWVERKRFSIALHYRAVDPKDVGPLESVLMEVARRHPDLRTMGGKKVFELRPNIDWDKGKAVLHLLDKFHVDGSQVVPLYIGDDVTDEDAFRAIGDRGVTILVSGHGQETSAKYSLSTWPTYLRS